LSHPGGSLQALGTQAAPRRLELKGGSLHLEGSPVVVEFSRRGFQIGCTFVTYEAFDKLIQMEANAK
jgi:hypothetical protein